MARENYLYDEERPLPYLVQLARVDGAPIDPRRRQSNPALMHLDLRGGEFSRPTTYRLAKTFDWLTRAFSIRKNQLDEYALMITALPPRDDEEITGGRTPYVPEDWPDLQRRSFLWIPTAYDPKEEEYAWQR
jgi:hypothetical protein